MSEKFSATLSIGDLNDYIAPSQGCVVSLKANSKAKLDKLGDFSKIANASTKLMQAEPVKISLKDCLACSGCITSAETVMLEKQSLDEFLSNIDKGKTVIVSLSPQSRASLSEYYGLCPLQVFRKLTTFFKSLGVKALFDTSCSRDLALIESCNEFIARYKQRQSSYDENHKSTVPIISSACPGWICYAEKTLGSYILPYISSVKSPQQTIGAIIKQHLCQKLCLRLLNVYTAQDDETGNDTDFLTNVTRTERLKVLKFGHGSVAHGRDSRYWDRDDRRRDEDYSEEALEHATGGARDGSTGNIHAVEKGNISDKKSSFAESHKGSNHRGISLYNEAGRDELKMYEAEYEASLKGAGRSRNEDRDKNQLSNDAAVGIHDEEVDADDEYDDGIDSHDSRAEDYDVAGHGQGDQKNVALSHVVDSRGSSDELHAGTKGRNIDEDMSGISTEDSSLTSLHSDEISVNSRHVSVVGGQSSRRSTSEKRSASKKKPKRHKFSGSCEMKILNSTSQLVEPLESRKFSRFALQYREVEENPNGEESWVPRFAGHQSLKEREESYIAQDQKINCGFVKGPKGSPSTGFDLAEDDSKYISSCHIAVSSCIFGNSDRLRIPVGKMVSRLSRKNVCFVMFVDEITLHTLSSEGHMPDTMGFIGLWKIVMVKNLPYTDMRRVGKIPKFLPHRLFPSARYSIWLDSKLRLQLDPLLILEYFIWRKGYEYAISNHYDRHCLWEEVAQNKKLNKFNHTIIDEQFLFYQADGLKRFNASDPNKLLPSNVPEGSFIVRAHTPMSNLFSCLWFNEVERFTPRDQLSFAYTYQKLRRTNPTKPFYLNMFKDCERRKVAKLFRHRSEESRYTAGHSTE